MNKVINTTSVDSPWVVKRKISVVFKEKACDDIVLERAIASFPGISYISVDTTKCEITIQYNVTRVRYYQIITEIKKAGASIKGGILSKWKQGWIEFTEINMRENAKAPPPACCNKPPKR